MHRCLRKSLSGIVVFCSLLWASFAACQSAPIQSAPIPASALVIDTVSKQTPRDLKMPTLLPGSAKPSCTLGSGDFAFVITVSEKGDLLRVSPLVGTGMHTDECATKSVQQLHFSPGMMNGTPVAVKMYFTYNSETK